MALFGSVETVRAQAPRTPAFAAAWKYIEEMLQPNSAAHRRLQALKRGDSERHELAGGVFAIEQAYDSKPRAEGFFESHRKYIDIQLIVAGNETMEVADIARAIVRDPYLEARDLIVYSDVSGASALRLQSGEVAIFFPADVHMPSLRTGDAAVLVRKSVLKLRVDA